MTTKGIHHATLAAAAKAGIVLTADGDAITVSRKAKPKFEFTVTASGKQALADGLAMLAIHTEWPGVAENLTQNEAGEWEVSIAGSEDFVGERLQSVLDAVLDFAQENEIDVNEGIEMPKAGVVVPEKYKAEYKARGDASGCGDWVFLQLKGRYEVTTEAGKRFDEQRYTDMLVLNGVPMTGKWASLPQSGQKGWEGRYRMNGGQLLRVRVAATGVLHIDEQTTLTCPQEDLEILWRKHPEAYTDWEEARQPAKTDEKGKSRRKAKEVEAA